MPIRASFIQDGIGLEFMASGVLSGSEIIKANETSHTRENLLRLKYKIVDRTACTEYRVTSDEIKIIAEQDKKAAAISPRLIVILISTTSLQYGMSRMWETYLEESGVHTELFADRESADAWLKTALAAKK